MASEEIGLVPTQGLNPQLVFQDDPNNTLGFRCGGGNGVPPQRHRPVGVGDPSQKATRELTGLYFQPQGTAEFRRNIYESTQTPDRHHHRSIQNWNGNGRNSTSPSGDGSEGDEDDDDDDEEDDDDDVDGLVVVENSSTKNNSSNTSGHSSEKIGNVKMNHISSFGSSREIVMKEGNIVQSGNDINDVRAASSSENHQHGRVSQYQNAITIADPDGELYYSQYLQGPEGSAAGHKDMLVENGCGFSGRKDVSYSCDSGDSLRAILSDPLTGALMDDAMILPCGHSFGGGGMQHIIRMKACCTCSQPVPEGSVAPNLSLRSAVQAFRREEESLVYRVSKRRRERFDQDKSSYGDSTLIDHQRGRGVQFPFAVTDRVIIKGNKRTPQRFVGREAVVTTQCLNGWYVVKTLDNAESVKLQYRSLAKVPDNPTTSKPALGKMTSNWL